MKAFDMGIKFIRARCITLYMYFLRKQTETEKSGHNVQAENMTQLYQPDHITTTRTLTEEASYKYLYVKGNISVYVTSTYINIITKISFPL
jgi:hypothetical protein